MTESQSDAAHKTVPSGDAANSDATTRLPTGGTPSVTDPGPGARPRMGKKSAWLLGGVVAVAALSVALSATARLSLSSSKTPITMAAAASSASPSASGPGADAAKAAPLATKSAGARRVPSASARPTGAPTRSVEAVSPPSPSPSTATTTAPAAAGTAVTPAAAGTAGTAATTSMPKPVSWWALNDDDPALAAQDAEGAHLATGTNVVWCGAGGGSGNCATFNGTDSAFTTSGPVLDTAPGSSFTVVASVYMTAYAPNNGSETIVSQDGADNSGFYLQYSGIDQRWAFARVVADTDQDPAGIRALSTSAPALSTWTILVGVFDASDDQLRLYVNGVLEGTATDTTPFAATGPLAIGRAQFDGQPTDWFNGAAGQIQVYNVALTSAEVADIKS